MSGFSLIEVLLALVVASVGVLGVAALQMSSLQNNRAALERVEAVLLAHDMLERMRANPAGTPPGADYALALGAGPPGAADCRAADCSAAQLAAFDQTAWKCLLGAYHDTGACLPVESGLARGRLPQGDGAVAVMGDVVRVTVRWLGGDSASQSITVSARL